MNGEKAGYKPFREVSAESHAIVVARIGASATAKCPLARQSDFEEAPPRVARKVVGLLVAWNDSEKVVVRDMTLQSIGAFFILMSSKSQTLNCTSRPLFNI